MSSEFVRNIHHTKLRGKTTEPLDTNIQNDILSDENNAYIRNEDPNNPAEHYTLLTGSLETDQLKSGESDILAIQKDNKHGVTLKPKHTKITTKTDTIKVSENKPLEFELDDTQVKTNKENIEINKTAIAKNAGDIKKNTDDIDDLKKNNLNINSYYNGILGALINGTDDSITLYVEKSEVLNPQLETLNDLINNFENLNSIMIFDRTLSDNDLKINDITEINEYISGYTFKFEYYKFFKELLNHTHGGIGFNIYDQPIDHSQYNLEKPFYISYLSGLN